MALRSSISNQRVGFNSKQTRTPRVAVSAVQTAEKATKATASPVDDVQFINPLWSQPSTEKEFLGLIAKLVEAGKCPAQLQAGWVDFYRLYRKTVESSGVADAERVATKVQATIADTVFNQFLDPYTFPSAHERLLEPYNYFAFGQRYVSTLIDFSNSFLGQAELWAKVAAQIAAGESVVLLANHQTEADPGVFAHMLMHSFPNLATDVIYVAGDRVVTDPLCKPFSMGRNLFCVHSKKHMNDEPELKASKMETNRKTLVAMQRAFNKGGALVWIAPSGGRDRPNADGHWTPDPFDPTAVELMASLIGRAKKPGHLYPMAMYSYPIMPPPKKVEANIGERRITAWSGVGISICPELDVAAITEQSGGDKEARAVALATTAYKAVCTEYSVLETAITQPDKRAELKAFTQPWTNSSSSTAASAPAAAAPAAAAAPKAAAPAAAPAPAAPAAAAAAPKAEKAAATPAAPAPAPKPAAAPAAAPAAQAPAAAAAAPAPSAAPTPVAPAAPKPAAAPAAPAPAAKAPAATPAAAPAAKAAAAPAAAAPATAAAPNASK